MEIAQSCAYNINVKQIVNHKTLKGKMSHKTAQRTWEATNNIQSVATIDDIFRYDAKQHQDILMAKPWEKE